MGLKPTPKIPAIEETVPHLASFTSDDPVVDPGRLVSADLAGDHFNLGCVGKRRQETELLREARVKRASGVGEPASRQAVF